MSVASMELIRAREAARQLLEHLNLATYLFEVEPGEGGWTLRVECAARDGWRTTTVPLSKDDLIASAADTAIFRQLADECRNRLDGCEVQH